ncbi:MAG: secretion protein HlyD [Desulfuromonas sp.]|nr:MAG: secretion protein HlyD [Desulfuromonas sp.]
MKKIYLLPLIVIVAAIVGFIVLNGKEDQPENRVRISGMIEATDANVSFKISGRIAKLYVDEGDAVTQGDLVAELEDVDQQLAVDKAKAQLAYQKALLDEALAGNRNQQIQEAQAAVRQAQAADQAAAAEQKQAELDQQRFAALYENGATTGRTLELYTTALEKSTRQLQQTQAALRQAEQHLSLIVEGTRSEAIAAAQAQVNVAQETVTQAEQQLSYTRLYAPLSGKILTRPAEEGEYYQPGGVVFTAAVLDEVWARVYISETDLGRVQLGQKALVRSDSWSERDFPGVVTYISDEAEFTPKSVQTYDERINFMYRVKITLANPHHDLKPGMPIEGVIVLE